MKTLVVAVLSLVAMAAHAGGDVLTRHVEADFEEVIENVEMAITDRGMTLSGTLHISDMLKRTGTDLGYTDSVYLKAESIEFCSARLTHLMTRLDPRNMVVCPFTVSVYVLPDDHERVYVSVRKPVLLGPDTAEVSGIVNRMLQDVVTESVE